MATISAIIRHLQSLHAAALRLSSKIQLQIFYPVTTAPCQHTVTCSPDNNHHHRRKHPIYDDLHRYFSRICTFLCKSQGAEPLRLLFYFFCFTLFENWHVAPSPVFLRPNYLWQWNISSPINRIGLKSKKSAPGSQHNVDLSIICTNPGFCLNLPRTLFDVNQRWLISFFTRICS